MKCLIFDITGPYPAQHDTQFFQLTLGLQQQRHSGHISNDTCTGAQNKPEHLVEMKYHEIEILMLVKRVPSADGQDIDSG
jgi:hypothetical protein